MSSQQTKRQFLGKLDNFTSKEERNFEKKHLRCYLRGDKFFEYGHDEVGQPIRREVQQILPTYEIIR
jgi:hypothetical protein